MKLRKLAFKRGDIGPISDDIPSIFPIVFGVLLFMGTAIYTTQKIDERNQYLDVRKSLVGLSYIALSGGYLGDDAFEASCKSQYTDYAKRRAVNFLISLKKYCNYVTLDQDKGGDIFSPITDYPGVNCPSFDPNCNQQTSSQVWKTGKTCPSGKDFPKIKTAGATPQLVSHSNKPPNFQTLSFPVSVQCNAEGSLKGPGLVNVIVWRQAR